jgi:DHA2 family multidrug resistance protein
MLIMPLLGRILRTVDARIIIVTGLAILAATLWRASEFTLDVSEQELVLNGLIQGFGTGMVFVPLATMTFATLDARFRTEATSMFALIRSLAISIGVSVDSTLLVRNTQLNHAELAAHITPFNHALQALVPNLTAQTAQGATIIDGEINRQAGMIAYDNLFELSMFLVFGAAILVMLVRLPKASAVPSDEPVLVEA